MKISEIPLPIVRSIHSPKWAGLFLWGYSMAASIMASIHMTWSSLGIIEMLFWKG